MLHQFDEYERPTEWLRALEQHGDGYSRLLAEAGSLTRAAYRLARARCQVAAIPMPVPTIRELRAAAIDIAEHLPDTPRPPMVSVLIEECESENLEVIPPLSQPGAA